jgi:hypothetical protein
MSLIVSPRETVSGAYSVRSRSQSLGVIGCRFVFRTGRVISPIQNPAYSPPPTHLLRFVVARLNFDGLGLEACVSGDDARDEWLT